jgi:hypothetical protein
MIKSKRMGLAGHMACTGEMRSTYKVWLESLKGRDHFEDLGIDGRIILNSF